MPGDPAQRSQRLEAIRTLVRRETVRSQEDLVERLRHRGFDVTQSSVSRDLRELPVDKVDGAYRLRGAEPASDEMQDALRGVLRDVSEAGPHLVVVKTVVGGASRVGILIDRAGWPEVVGTVAGDDTLFVATAGAAQGRIVRQRLEELMGREVGRG